jgi:hypothetical protein
VGHEECAINVAAKRGLEWKGGSEGWRTPSIKQPDIAGLDPPSKRAQATIFQESIANLTAGLPEEWQKICNQPAETPASTTTTTEAVPVIDGTYDIQFSNGSGMCVPQYSGVVEIHSTGSTAKFTKGDDQSSFSAPIGADLSFSYDGPDSNGNRVNASAQFSKGTGGDVLLRGTWETTFSSGAQKACGYDIFGKKR